MKQESLKTHIALPVDVDEFMTWKKIFSENTGKALKSLQVLKP